jgi:hypothetical protein
MDTYLNALEKLDPSLVPTAPHYRSALPLQRAARGSKYRLYNVGQPGRLLQPEEPQGPILNFETVLGSMVDLAPCTLRESDTRAKRRTRLGGMLGGSGAEDTYDSVPNWLRGQAVPSRRPHLLPPEIWHQRRRAVVR